MHTPKWTLERLYMFGPETLAKRKSFSKWDNKKAGSSSVLVKRCPCSVDSPANPRYTRAHFPSRVRGFRAGLRTHP
jgi:hypothetical protein